MPAYKIIYRKHTTNGPELCETIVNGRESRESAIAKLIANGAKIVRIARVA